VPAPSGRPDLQVSGRAARLCQQHGVTGMFVSLSDEGEYGVAVVVLERSDCRPPLSGTPVGAVQ
jgi:holo-[acyl-carrier protein] synthase